MGSPTDPKRSPEKANDAEDTRPAARIRFTSSVNGLISLRTSLSVAALL